MSAVPIPFDKLADHARRYLALGFRPVAVHRDTKSPIPTGWPDLVPTAEQVEQWFPGANLGLICGPQPNHPNQINLLAIDVDTKKGGDQTWADLLATNPPLPPHPVHTTPSGGEHHFFDAPIGWCLTTADGLGTGIDTRGVGGQVVAPPSRYIDADGVFMTYSSTPATSLLTVPVPALPVWLGELLAARAAGPRIELAARAASDDDGMFKWLRANFDYIAELEADGWEQAGRHPDGVLMTRPGKATRDGHSALWHRDRNWLTVWSGTVEWQDQIFPSMHVNRDGSTSWTPFNYLRRVRFDGDFDDTQRYVLKLMGKEPPARAAAGGPKGDNTSVTRLPVVDDAYWSATERNAQICQAARSRLVSPDALDVVMFALQSCLIPPGYMLEPIVGGLTPLNMLACLVAGTGDFKSSTLDVALDLLGPFPPWVATIGMGSGEGIGAMFLKEEITEDAKGKKVKTGRLVRNDVKAVFFQADEGATIAAVADRKGATIIANLCKAWSGSMLGEANADLTTRRQVMKNDYRVGAVVNIQPANFAKLFSEANTETGMTGRFLFSGTLDADIPDVEPEWPGSFEFPVLPQKPQLITVDPAIIKAAKAAVRERHRSGHLSNADGQVAQAPATLARMAAIHAVFDGRFHVTPDDWFLAGQRAAVSASCLATLSSWDAGNARDRGHKSVKAKAAAAVEEEDEADRLRLGRAADRILSVLAHGPLAPSAITAKLTSLQRPYRDTALDHLAAMGKVVRDGDRWALTP